MRRLIIQAIGSILLFQMFCSENAHAQTYENTNQEKAIFKKYLKNYQGTLICKGIKGIIQNKLVTYLVADAQSKAFYLYVFNTNTNQWIKKSEKMYPDVIEDDYADFWSRDKRVSLEIGVGKRREEASRYGASYSNSSDPYAAGADYQFHNVCKLELRRIF
jgi:hypothetical protein